MLNEERNHKAHTFLHVKSKNVSNTIQYNIYCIVLYKNVSNAKAAITIFHEVVPKLI